MRRELNPSIFGTNPPSSADREGPESGSSPAVQPQYNYMPVSNSQQVGLGSADAQIISVQIEGLKEKIKQLVHRTQTQDAIIEELVGSSQIKFERFKQAFHRVEEFVKNNINELNGRFGKLNSRIVSQNYNDSKLEQMMQKHNEIILAFEAKLSKVQKVMSDQEIQLMNYKGALEEARHEIARLKRL